MQKKEKTKEEIKQEINRKLEQLIKTRSKAAVNSYTSHKQIIKIETQIKTLKNVLRLF